MEKNKIKVMGMKEIKDREKKAGLALHIGNRLQGISEP